MYRTQTTQAITTEAMQTSHRNQKEGTDTDTYQPAKPADNQEFDSSRPWQSDAVLRELYHGRGLTTREIANRLGCTNGTVSRWLSRHNIEARDNWRPGLEAAREENREEYVTQRTLPSGYEYWASREMQANGDRVNRIVYIHRLLAVAAYGYDAVAGMDVHHENGIPWDNRPKNLTTLDASEHGHLHATERWNERGEA